MRMRMIIIIEAASSTYATLQNLFSTFCNTQLFKCRTRRTLYNFPSAKGRWGVLLLLLLLLVELAAALFCMFNNDFPRSFFKTKT